MDDKNIKFFEPSNSLILNKEIVSSSNINDEILKIKNLVKAKYLTTEKLTPTELKTSNDTDFISIRNSAKKINNDIKEKTLLINNSIVNKKNEIKALYFEKKLLDQNQVQSNIIINQQKLINNYKKNINKLRFELNKVEKKLKENIYSNENLIINNNEFKKTISHYINNNKKLEDIINKMKNIISHNSLSPKQINEMTNKIKFYQEENIRLSSELNSLQNKYSTIKNNFTTMELEKNNIYKQIHELNNSLIKTNIIGTPFVKELIKEDSINSKVLNDITNNNLQEDKKEFETKKILDNEITDIFN
jgi:hypothetical protein